MPDELDPRDGPTPEFKNHHVVVGRRGGSGGKRVQSKLEQMLTAGQIKPEESEAGWRFGNDFRAADGRTKSSMDLSMGGGSGDDPAFYRLDYVRAYENARAALDGVKYRYPLRERPSRTLLRCVVDDESFPFIADRIGLEWEAAKARIIRYLGILAEHYERVDKSAKKSTTVHTKAAALKRFEAGEAA